MTTENDMKWAIHWCGVREQCTQKLDSYGQIDRRPSMARTSLLTEFDQHQLWTCAFGFFRCHFFNFSYWFSSLSLGSTTIDTHCFIYLFNSLAVSNNLRQQRITAWNESNALTTQPLCRLFWLLFSLFLALLIVVVANCHFDRSISFGIN